MIAPQLLHSRGRHPLCPLHSLSSLLSVLHLFSVHGLYTLSGAYDHSLHSFTSSLFSVLHSLDSPRNRHVFSASALQPLYSRGHHPLCSNCTLYSLFCILSAFQLHSLIKVSAFSITLCSVCAPIPPPQCQPTRRLRRGVRDTRVPELVYTRTHRLSVGTAM